jgi:hypothetical protein
MLKGGKPLLLRMITTNAKEIDPQLESRKPLVSIDE